MTLQVPIYTPRYLNVCNEEAPEAGGRVCFGMEKERLKLWRLEILLDRSRKEVHHTLLDRTARRITLCTVLTNIHTYIHIPPSLLKVSHVIVVYYLLSDCMIACSLSMLLPRLPKVEK